MLQKYIHAAMSHAHYELLADDEGYYGEIPPCPGVLANAPNLESCRDQLEEVLEEWILFRNYRNLPFPVIDEMKLPIWNRFF